MGVVYKGAHALYAVHIPDNGAETNAQGTSVFAGYVRGFESNEKKSGELFVFINGLNRISAEEEAHNLKSLLNAKDATLYRIMKNLGPESGKYQADSASILVQGGGRIDLKYKHVPDDQYIQGGKSEVGQYLRREQYTGNIVPNDYADPQGWHIVDGVNARCIKIK